MDKISTFEKTFVDEKGRERIFSGVNIVDKSFYHEGPQNYMDIDEALIKRVHDSGFNIIRLGFTWAKLEPVPGQYNDAYLDSVSTILDYCEKYNIFAFLDMHQDIYGPADGTYGDGAPQWAMLTDGYKTHPQRLIWAEAYFWGKACHRAFDNFWANKAYKGKGLQDYYEDCWKYVVKKIGHKPAVIGYDIMNEPFNGTDGGKCFRNIVKGAVKIVLFGKEINTRQIFKDALSKDRVPKVLSHITYDVLRKVTSTCDDLIETFDTKKYAPFISKISTAVRQEDASGIVFMENSYYSNLGIPFKAPPIMIDGKKAENQAFAPHGYDLIVDTPMYKYASNERVNGIYTQHKIDQDRLNVPVLVGEWGGFGDGGDEWLPHIEYLLKFFDNNKWSNTYWCYIPDFFESALMRVFIRPFPKAVSGKIIEYNYDRENKEFTLSFEQSKDDCGETIISMPFEATGVEIDSKKAKIKQNETELYINTKEGTHNIKVKF